MALAKKNIKKDLDLDGLSLDIIYDKIVWHRLINVPIMASGFGFCNVSYASCFLITNLSELVFIGRYKIESVFLKRMEFCLMMSVKLH